LAIKYDDDTHCSMADTALDTAITALDIKVSLYENIAVDTRPSFCFNADGNAIGRPASSGNLQHFTQAECRSLPNSVWYENGECNNSIPGEASYSLRCYSATGGNQALIASAAADLSGSFQPIGQYYANLVSIKERLNNFIECSTEQIQDAKPYSVNSERYVERANPEDAVMPRELVFGLFSQLRPSSIPIVMAAGVFMSCLALLIIFQMFGFTGEIHIPPALTKMQGAVDTVPLYQNPMVLSGISIVLGAAVIILGVMYYRSKK
jgi:hypothetical protein